MQVHEQLTWLKAPLKTCAASSDVHIDEAAVILYAALAAAMAADNESVKRERS